MSKTAITETILRVELTPEISEKVFDSAQRQKVSTSEVVNGALEFLFKYASDIYEAVKENGRLRCRLAEAEEQRDRFRDKYVEASQ